MNVQHALHSHRRTPGTIRLGIERFDNLSQLSPWDHVVHLVKEPLSSDWLAIPFKGCFSEGLLMHSVILWASDAKNRITELGRNKSEVP